jgi:hypothetical protein
MPPVREQDWAIGRRPRFEAPGVELVVVVPSPNEAVQPESSSIVCGYVFRLQHEKDWRIDGIEQQQVALETSPAGRGELPDCW